MTPVGIRGLPDPRGGIGIPAVPAPKCVPALVIGAGLGRTPVQLSIAAVCRWPGNSVGIVRGSVPSEGSGTELVGPSRWLVGMPSESAEGCARNRGKKAGSPLGERPPIIPRAQESVPACPSGATAKRPSMPDAANQKLGSGGAVGLGPAVGSSEEATEGAEPKPGAEDKWANCWTSGLTGCAL
jgi:hypothetical protein